MTIHGDTYICLPENRERMWAAQSFSELLKVLTKVCARCFKAECECEGRQK